jgi:type IV secretory pathway VirB3-like protein
MKIVGAFVTMFAWFAILLSWGWVALTILPVFFAVSVILVLEDRK